MKIKSSIAVTIVLLLLMGVSIFAQEPVTFTGTALIYGTGLNTRTVTRNFTLRLRGTTTDQNVNRDLSLLQERGQDALLNAIRKEDLGTMSLGGQPALTINAARVEDLGNGQRRIRAVMERWMGFGELRGGYRSTDYPFSYVEIVIDRAGRGEGTIIPAAQIRFRTKNGQPQVEIEDFGTFPGRLMGVTMRGRLP